MATILKRGDRWRAWVRRKGYTPRSESFPTRALAKIWADRVEMEISEAIARGTPQGAAAVTIAELVDWYRRDVGKLKRVSKTQAGNLTLDIPPMRGQCSGRWEASVPADGRPAFRAMGGQ